MERPNFAEQYALLCVRLMNDMKSDMTLSYYSVEEFQSVLTKKCCNVFYSFLTPTIKSTYQENTTELMVGYRLWR